MASGLPSLMYRTVWGADYDKGYRYGYRRPLSFSIGMVPHAPYRYHLYGQLMPSF